MTDATPLASEQITQEDREAAARLADIRVQDQRNHTARRMREGKLDHFSEVQAFARHRIAALSATPAPSDQDASQAQGEVPSLWFQGVNDDNMQGIVRAMRAWTPEDDSTSQTHEPGATAQDALERCSFCVRRASTSVSDDSDVFPCCARCASEWKADPGFAKDRRATPTIPAGMVAEVERLANLLLSLEIAPISDSHAGVKNGKELIRAHSIARSLLAAAPKQAEPQGVEEALAARDKAVSVCPFEQGKKLKVSEPCPVCQADSSEPCRKRIIADAKFVDAARAALNAPTGAVEKGEAK